MYSSHNKYFSMCVIVLYSSFFSENKINVNVAEHLSMTATELNCIALVSLLFQKRANIIYKTYIFCFIIVSKNHFFTIKLNS